MDTAVDLTAGDDQVAVCEADIVAGHSATTVDLTTGDGQIAVDGEHAAQTGRLATFESTAVNGNSSVAPRADHSTAPVSRLDFLIALESTAVDHQLAAYRDQAGVSICINGSSLGCIKYTLLHDHLRTGLHMEQTLCTTAYNILRNDQLAGLCLGEVGNDQGIAMRCSQQTAGSISNAVFPIDNALTGQSLTVQVQNDGGGHGIVLFLLSSRAQRVASGACSVIRHIEVDDLGSVAFSRRIACHQGLPVNGLATVCTVAHVAAGTGTFISYENITDLSFVIGVAVHTVTLMQGDALTKVGRAGIDYISSVIAGNVDAGFLAGIGLTHTVTLQMQLAVGNADHVVVSTTGHFVNIGTCSCGINTLHDTVADLNAKSVVLSVELCSQLSILGLVGAQLAAN